MTIDLKKEMEDLYRAPSDQAVLLDVPERRFLMVDGQGDPNSSPAYEAAMKALYSTAYGVKFAVKAREPGADFVVPPSEGLWWSDDMSDFVQGRREGWRWTMMIPLPASVTREDVDAALEGARRKAASPALDALRFEAFAEGRCAQIMHVGPYSAEGSTIEKLHASIVEQGSAPVGKHHEIYLSDPGRTAPERMKTLIRQPIADA
jgi:hypothetical protein